MARFSFKAVKSSGEVYTGIAEAEDQYALAHRLKQEGNTLVSAEEDAARGGTRFMDRINAAIGNVKLREKIMFARNLSAMISAGLSLSRALQVLERQTKNKTFKGVLGNLGGAIQQGTAFSVALGSFPTVFPPLLIAMVRAGEESGRLAESLETVALQMSKMYELRRRIRGAMMYPSIVVSAMILVGIALMVFVVPTLTETFRELEVDLPLSTRVVIALSDFVKNHSAIFFGSLAAVILGIVAWFRRPSGKRVFETILLHFPIIKEMVRESNAAQTTRTLSSLLVSGVEVVSAIGITKEVIQNTYFKGVLAKAEETVPKGGSLAEVFLEDDTLYPVLVGEMVSVGEEAGNLPEMLLRVAEFYEGEVSEKTKNISTIIEPILMVLIGIVVGFFAVSMISPIYSIADAI
ncbi:type II secretion system F family protein [Candidatus Wolfebacteria bacterium]|nr:type II secretion system F family protein [Candidatus Wolfebacteria bacterium]